MPAGRAGVGELVRTPKKDAGFGACWAASRGDAERRVEVAIAYTQVQEVNRVSVMREELRWEILERALGACPAVIGGRQLGPDFFARWRCANLRLLVWTRPRTGKTDVMDRVGAQGRRSALSWAVARAIVDGVAGQSQDRIPAFRSTRRNTACNCRLHQDILSLLAIFSLPWRDACSTLPQPRLRLTAHQPRFLGPTVRELMHVPRRHPNPT